MHVTHSFLGTTRGDFGCLFFLLLEDYVQVQTQFFQELDLYLERFARQLGDASAVVRPFVGDIEHAHESVLQKPWSQEQLAGFGTPSLLMIDKDFDEFDPREHAWVILNFGPGKATTERELGSVEEVGQLLTEIASAVTSREDGIFTVVQELQHDIDAADVSHVFELKPGIFGCSVDLKRGAQLARRLVRRLRR